MHRRQHLGRRFVAAALALGALIAAAGNATATTAPPASVGPQTSGGTLVFGTSTTRVVLDPALRQRRRVAARHSTRSSRPWSPPKPGGTEIEPLLADSLDRERRRPRLDLHPAQRGEVPRRHAFNAEAVCFNFDRWYNFTGVAARARPFVLLEHRLRWLRRNGANGTPPRASTRAARPPTTTRPSSTSPRRRRRSSAVSSLAAVLDRQPGGAHRVRGRQGRRHRATPPRSTAPSAPSTRSAPARSCSRAGSAATS